MVNVTDIEYSSVVYDPSKMLTSVGVLLIIGLVVFALYTVYQLYNK